MGIIPIMKFLPRIIFALIISLAFNSLAAGALGLLSGKNARKIWKSQQGASTRPQRIGKTGTPTLRMTCPFSRGFERCFWDADITLDLSDASGITMDIHISQPGSISRGTIYLHSGDGWYGGWFTISGSNPHKVRIPRRDFGTEDSPAGWDKIDRIRLAFWRGNGKDTTVTVAHPTIWSDEIVLLYNSYAIKNTPAETSTIKHAADDIFSWFAANGIEIGKLNDEDITHGIPKKCQLLILPYNPQLPPSTVKTLRSFAASGGRIILCYALEPPTAALLGLRGKDWMAATKKAEFSTIVFINPSKSGLPRLMRQDSWNANIPQLGSAKVLAYWRDGAGTTSRRPAVTINTNGIFVGHILMDTDRDNKARFLVAASIMLCPDLKQTLLSKMLANSEKLLSFSNWEQTREFIHNTASKAGFRRRTKVSLQLSAIDHYRKTTAEMLATAPTGTMIERMSVLRQLVRQAYFSAVPDNGVRHELRGVWCHKAQGIPGMSWNQTISTLKKSGFNTIFANMLWPGCAYYPSKVVPPPQPGDPAQGDQLADCLKACRAQGIRLHLWKVCWNLGHASPAFIAKMRREQRLQKTASGSEKNWLCPSDPRNRQLELNAMAEAVRNYAVDGIHLDYIRYPDDTCCYCSGCRKRFEATIGRKIRNWPADVVSGSYRKAFQQWRRHNITSFVKTASQAVKKARPKIKFSVAVFGSWPSCRDSIAQDWVNWAKAGYVDFVCPMNYVTDDTKAAELITKQLKDVGKACPVYPGLGPSARNLPPEQVIHQLQIIRKAGVRGFLLFDLDRDLIDRHLPALSAGATSK